MEQLVPLLWRQFAFQSDFILEYNFVGAGPVYAHVRGYATQRNSIAIRTHPHTHVHASCQGSLQQVVRPEARMRTAMIGGCVGEALMLTVREPGLVSRQLARSADHLFIIGAVRQVYKYQELWVVVSFSLRVTGS
jgi:hypothetical protein